MNKTDSFLHRLHLRARERQIVRLLRNQVAAASSILEVVLAILVLIGLLISTVPIAQEMFNLVSTRSTEAFQTFLGHAFNLVIGIEFIKMLAKHSPGSALEVLLYAIARQMILGHESALESFISVASIGLIFLIRRFVFVPSFGSTMPDGQPAPDTEPNPHEGDETFAWLQNHICLRAAPCPGCSALFAVQRARVCSKDQQKINAFVYLAFTLGV